MTSEQRTRSKSCGRNQSSPSSDEHRYKTMGMIFGNLDPVRYDRRIDPPPKACFNCWSFDHKRKFCTKSVTSVYCCNCGRSGLTVKNCPRCVRAYQELKPNKRAWIDENFNFNEVDNREQMTTRVKENGGNDENWDGNYDEDNYQNANTDNENRKYDETKDKSKEYNDEDIGWEPVKSYHSLTTVFAEPNEVFDYMRAQKIRDEFESDKINNVAVNLDETRMADKDSCEENSVVSSIDDFLKKDEEALRSTGEPLLDILNLLTAVKHLPVDTQNVVILQYMLEKKKKQMAEDEMQSIKKTKSP